jgi:hypothetical protein
VAIPHSYGRYTIVGPSDGSSSPAAEGSPAVAPEARREIGDGAESVYVYYLPRDRQYAELAGASRWRCKIGRTVGLAEARIRGQAGTALSERPRIDLVIHTQDGRVLEDAVHAILTLKGRLLGEAPGKEWFLTSPGEVESMYESLTKSWN